MDTTAVLNDLEKCKTYEIQVRTVCLADTTSYNTIYTLKTDCDVAVQEVDPFLASFEVFPNPVTDKVFIRLQPVTSGDHVVSIYSIQGQPLQHRVVFADTHSTMEMSFDQMENYPPGLYFVVVRKDGYSATKKIIKI